MLLAANSFSGIGTRWEEPANPHRPGSRRACYLGCPSRGHYVPEMERNGNPEPVPVSGILRKQLPAGGGRAGKDRV